MSFRQHEAFISYRYTLVEQGHRFQQAVAGYSYHHTTQSVASLLNVLKNFS